MKRMTKEEVKEIEIKILEEIHDICIKNNLRYSLCGGTLLGAIRHKGFIPWDDDIDILMPRTDYYNLMMYCKNNVTNFKMLSSITVEGYFDLGAKAIDNRTYLEDESINIPEQYRGVFIDVLPIDGLGNTMTEAKKVFHSTSLYRELLVASLWKRYKRSKTHSITVEPIRLALYIISRLIKPETLVNKIHKIVEKRQFDEQEFCGCIWGSYREKEILPRRVFSEYVDLIFEEKKFKCFRNYNEYLSSIYGDYMKLPPVEKQVSHHYFEAYWK